MPPSERRPLRGWKAVVGLLGFPIILLSGVFGAWLLLKAGYSALVASVAIVIPGAILVGLLERALPFRQSWRAPKEVLFIDLVHSLVSANAVLPLLRATVLAFLAAASVWLVERFGGSAWPATWPVPLQVGLAVLVADLGAYAGHRFMHSTRFGWRLHAVHHTPQRLDFLAAGRAHPFNAMLTISLEHGSLILLGASPTTLILFTVYKGLNGLMQHSNVDFRTGVLGYVFATQDAHRWHHSHELDESNRNFGNTTLVWDHVFGSFAVPKDRVAPAILGTTDAVIPENYFVHLTVPFTLQRYELATPPTQASEPREHASG